MFNVSVVILDFVEVVLVSTVAAGLFDEAFCSFSPFPAQEHNRSVPRSICLNVLEVMPQWYDINPLL